MAEVPALRTFVILRLGDERFGVAVKKVQEVRPFEGAVTRVPCSDASMRGVINVRGHVVPLVDLNRRLGLASQPRTMDSRVIVVEVDWDGERVLVGAIADAVYAFLELAAEDFVAPPAHNIGIAPSFLLGLARRDDGFVKLLDIDAVLQSTPTPPGRHRNPHGMRAA